MESLVAEPNGIYKLEKRFDKVDEELNDLKDDLAKAIRGLSMSIDRQSTSILSFDSTVDKLNTKFESFLHIASNAIPIKAVGWMFAIILIFVVLLIAGIEGIKVLSKAWMPLL
jgi:uncharacterized protein YukE